MHSKLFAGVFIALLMTAVQASAATIIYSDDFNRPNSSTVSTTGNTWYGHEDHFDDIAIYHNQLKLGAQDPHNDHSTNSSWAIHQVEIPASYTGIVSLTLSFDFHGLDSFNDDFLVVSWDYATGAFSPNTNPLANVLHTYTLGDNSTVISDSYTFNFDTSVSTSIAIEFAVDVDGGKCKDSKKKKCDTKKDYFEGVKIDNVVLMLNPPIMETPQVPLPASLPMFVGGLGALGLLVRSRKRKAKSEQA
jgi:PEP-CTERM motif